MKFLQLLIIIYCSTACKSQESTQIIKVIVTNRSTSTIDSISLLHKADNLKEQIKPGEIKIINVDVSDIDSHREGAMDIWLYQKGKKWNGTWGFHDFGFARTVDSIFLYNHGINYKDEDLKKPGEFNLYLTDMSSHKIDSVAAKEIIKTRIFRLQKGNIKMMLNYELFEQSPTVVIHEAGKSYAVKIDHDWQDWNNNQEILYYLGTGILSRNPK